MIATTSADIGHAHVALATDPRTAAAQQLVHWREAHTWFQKSREILQVFRDQGKLTGGDSVKFDRVNEGLAKCDAALTDN